MVNHRQGDGGALLHAAAELVGILVQKAAVQVHQIASSSSRRRLAASEMPRSGPQHLRRVRRRV